ncbi:nucleotidyltransferase domain-containing protein [bacterium]|nr:nucleotidyltransferase domain-containing protein [bacterium]MBU1983646.1 nucleotidyltransferase domain-containing protein [bacterium]
MVSREDIRKLCDRIVERFHPHKVILFGSYAYGHPSPDSDVDLLVVMPHEGHASLTAAEIRGVVHGGFPLDLIVRSPAVIRQRLEWEDFFLREILEKGEVLYEAPHDGVD